VTVDGNGNLTGIIDPAGGVRTFTYNTSHQLINDQIGVLNATFAYDASSALLTTVTLDQSQSAYLKVASAAGAPLNSPAINLSAGAGVLTDALSRPTTYLMDGLGRITQLRTPDGATQSWSLNSAGLPTVYTDARVNPTTYTYDGFGDVTRIDYADNSAVTYTYDPTYHKVSVYEDPRSVPGNRLFTTYTYDQSNGDLRTVTDALGKVTSYTWNSGVAPT
jgi:YD repeat-containing protein